MSLVAAVARDRVRRHRSLGSTDDAPPDRIAERPVQDAVDDRDGLLRQRPWFTLRPRRPPPHAARRRARRALRRRPGAAASLRCGESRSGATCARNAGRGRLPVVRPPRATSPGTHAPAARKVRRSRRLGLGEQFLECVFGEFPSAEPLPTYLAAFSGRGSTPMSAMKYHVPASRLAALTRWSSCLPSLLAAKVSLCLRPRTTSEQNWTPTVRCWAYFAPPT